MTGSESLRSWLQERQTSPDALAALAGLHRSLIYSYLSGRRRPGLQTALVLRDLTGIPVEAWAKPATSPEEEQPETPVAA